MNETRSDTLFSLRYAVRVLERQARMQGICATVLKACSLLSGTGALMALTAQAGDWGIALGIIFAVLQATEFAADPAARRAEALATRLLYARVLARQATMGDADLEAAYLEVVAEDTITLPKSLQHLAYDDVVRERGMDPAHLYNRHRLLDALS